MGLNKKQHNKYYPKYLEAGRKAFQAYKDRNEPEFHKQFAIAVELSKYIVDPKSLYLLYSKKLDLYKIGVSNDVDKRVSQLKSTVEVDDIEVLYEIHKSDNLEKELHKEFEHLNIVFRNSKGQNQTEWFLPEDVILSKFKELWH